MSQFYPTGPDLRDSRDILPMLRELFSKHPEYRYHEARELQHVLRSMGHTDGLAPEAEIAAATEVARSDYDPDLGAA
jgi:hypothetical protein